MEPKISDEEYEAFNTVALVLDDNGRERLAMKIRGYADGLMALPASDALPLTHPDLDAYMEALVHGREDCKARN